MNIPEETLVSLVKTIYNLELKGWAIKNYDSFVVTWEDDDGFPNWCSCSAIGTDKRVERETWQAQVIMISLMWSKDEVSIVGKTAERYLQELERKKS